MIGDPRATKENWSKHLFALESSSINFAYRSLFIENDDEPRANKRRLGQRESNERYLLKDNEIVISLRRKECRSNKTCAS